MATTAFDTHKFVKRLEEVGVPLPQAEAQAELLTEAFAVQQRELVTKDYFESRLDARFSEQKAYIDSRFAAQDVNINQQFAAQDVNINQRFAKLDSRFAAQDVSINQRFAKLDSRFAAQDANFNKRFGELDSRFAEIRSELAGLNRYLTWSQAIILAAVIIPVFQWLYSL